MDLVDLCEGKVINKRWVVDAKLGEGSCATVYKVHDLKNPKMRAALKVEARCEDGLGVLKKEVSVMQKLQGRSHTVRVVCAARRELYSYVVMTLFGSNLLQLKKENNLDTFTASTVNRIGVHALYAIKQIHEIGYVHRDVKPANMVIGRRGAASRIIYLIDYGMAREYAIWEDGYARIRRQREHVLMRGTTRYCSPGVHDRKEQGRKDDLWSLVYVLVELHAGLPWRGKNESEVKTMKERIADNVLMVDCPPEWIRIMKYIRTLDYESRPDYKRIFDTLMESIKRLKVSFADPYDWEREKKISNTQSKSMSDSSPGGNLETPPTTDALEFTRNDIGI